jgi:Tfp pilus assembly protein FimV
MRTTVNLDKHLVDELLEATGLRKTSDLIARALMEMREREAARSLIALGGSDPSAWAPNEGED